LGFAAAHADTISVLEKVRPMYEANALAIRFADIALNTPGFVEKSVKRVLDGKKYLEDELDKLGIEYYKSFANFMMINVGSFEKSVQVGAYLYQKRILIKSGLKEDMFRNYIRVSIGSTDQMKTFLDNFKEVYFSAGQKK
jgi:histidinol-phosphate aminotransferase